MIASLYNKIIAILTVAAKHAIPFTSPKSHYNKSQPGWNEHDSVFKDEAINWHVIWKMSGSPPEGYVFEMRKAIMYTMRVMYICVQLMLPRLLIESIYYCCLEIKKEEFLSVIFKIFS